ncbi:universal stress protein [Caenimonas terrae]|uniref:Universal stress protein n=1 Tax=Caenimonas terrae TaxID=696074 RepID=A0ABW0NEA6_9BURK
MYQRILVPVDGSPASERGVQEAIGLAGKLNARLLFLHVLDDYPMLQEMTTAGALDAMLRDLRHAGLDVLARARQAAEQAGVHCETLMREVAGRRVADVIVDQIGLHHCDLVAIGTHGRRGLARLAMGSDAEQVVRHSPVPVLLVRQAASATG